MRESSGSCGTCGSYLKNILKFLLSHIGLVSLVVGYTIVGALTFAKLEAQHEVLVKKNMSSVREKVTDRLWDITNDMHMLEELEWSEKARETLKDFEKSLVKAIKQDGWDGVESNEPKQWTFAGALFYSIILITTIGYGHIAPKTPWGKVVTIFYAIPGVPLMMLCLANIGDGMAHSFRFLYWKVCCYACTKRPKKRRRTKSSSRLSRSSSHHSNMGPPRARPSSLRRSGRGSERSTDPREYEPHQYHPREYEPHHHDPHNYNPHQYDPTYPDPEYRSGRAEFDEDRPSGRVSRTGSRERRAPDLRGGKGGRDSHTSRLSLDREGEDQVSVLYNKYAVEDNDGGTSETAAALRPAERSPAPSIDRRDRSSREDRVSDQTVVDQPRGSRNRSPSGSVRQSLPPLSPHLQPPPRSPRPPARPDPAYLDDYEYSDGFDEDPVDETDPSDKPVPIWLGVMLVVAYILGGAVLFSGWENWEFLDSVYFCFITLTTIGFGDFVPAQEGKENQELSIALCSLYLLFGIALLAMSFNLVQEEVINNVKNVARRLGIIKEEELYIRD
ncbi:uncharacterized protein LOC108680332 isoform X2 [Hyalella azteca]|uniref:Uncharacterized protein LOC108680332 isoform X2 n=1 Tax=Hyalella azteca TaxID=294128 RepID=A0A979FPD9_HYAAZ|nr:uncharacterized protein LOC108680332 isoform X2 [Hyalella azteca]